MYNTKEDDINLLLWSQETPQPSKLPHLQHKYKYAQFLTCSNYEIEQAKRKEQ